MNIINNVAIVRLKIRCGGHDIQCHCVVYNAGHNERLIEVATDFGCGGIGTLRELDYRAGSPTVILVMPNSVDPNSLTPPDKFGVWTLLYGCNHLISVSVVDDVMRHMLFYDHQNDRIFVHSGRVYIR